MKTRSIEIVITAALLLGTIVGPAMASNSIMDVLNAHPDSFTVLVNAIQAAGLADTLKKGNMNKYLNKHFIQNCLKCENYNR